MTIGEHFTDGIVCFEHGLVAGLVSNHGELARPGEFGVVGSDFEFGGGRGDVGKRIKKAVAPVMFRAELESSSHEFITFRIVSLQLLARANGAVVPIIDAIAVK